MRFLIMPLFALLACVATTPKVDAQEMAVRFEMGTVGDTLFTFNTGRYTWISEGQQGIVVDPRRRDALIARFRVARVEGANATAVVTGLAAPLAAHHAVLINQPTRAWYLRRSFWIGTLLGAAAGYFIGSS